MQMNCRRALTVKLSGRLRQRANGCQARVPLATSAGRDEDEVDAEGHLRLIDRPVLAHVEAINVEA